MLLCLNKEKNAEIRDGRVLARINKENVDREEELPELIEELK